MSPLRRSILPTSHVKFNFGFVWDLIIALSPPLGLEPSTSIISHSIVVLVAVLLHLLLKVILVVHPPPLPRLFHVMLSKFISAKVVFTFLFIVIMHTLVLPPLV